MVRFHVDCKCPLDAVFRRFIEEFEEWSSMNKHITRYKEILETVMKGLELLEMWEGTSCFNFFHYLRYGFQIRQLERETNSFLQDYSRHRFSEEVRHLLRKLNEHGQKYELGSMDESKMKETIFKHVSKLTNDPQQNAMILQHMCADNTFDGALVEVPCETISDYHKERPLKCLETSIDVLDEEARECFLDLGSFPEYRKICVAALLDIWVYVRKIEWWEAFVILLELASRNLLNLTGNPGNQAINSFEEFEEYLRQHDGKLDSSKMYFSQHDDVRDLALDMASGDPIVRRKRLFMPRKKESLPEDWELSKDQAFDAQIVSIHTGTIEKNQWCKMNFCEAEALVLLFSATNYSLPSFLSEMKKLKVLIIFSYGSKRATVKGLPLLSSLAQLKIVRLWVSPI